MDVEAIKRARHLDYGCIVIGQRAGGSHGEHDQGDHPQGQTRRQPHARLRPGALGESRLQIGTGWTRREQRDD